MPSTKIVKREVDEKTPQTESQETVSETAKNVCHVCNLSAIVMPVEKLSNNGIVMEAIHLDRTIHCWAEYKSFWDVGRRKSKKPIRIKCPRCGKMGRINEYKPDLHKKPENVAYFVAHEKLKGKWGRDKTIAKLRRCYIRDPVQRDTVLMKLGRYIPPP
jgi:hypothetical protein